MQPVLFDTSIYITALRLGPVAALYAGTSTRSRHIVERLGRDFHRARRILVPNLTDWTQTGKVLALLAAKYDYEQIGKGRLTNDSLIAMSAGRLGITVITANARDFAKLAEFRPFQWRVEKPDAN